MVITSSPLSILCHKHFLGYSGWPGHSRWPGHSGWPGYSMWPGYSGWPEHSWWFGLARNKHRKQTEVAVARLHSAAGGLPARRQTSRLRHPSVHTVSKKVQLRIGEAPCTTVASSWPNLAGDVTRPPLSKWSKTSSELPREDLDSDLSPDREWATAEAVETNSDVNGSSTLCLNCQWLNNIVGCSIKQPE